jgi:hypothetical protein
MYNEEVHNFYSSSVVITMRRIMMDHVAGVLGVSENNYG